MFPFPFLFWDFDFSSDSPNPFFRVNFIQQTQKEETPKFIGWRTVKTHTENWLKTSYKAM